MSSKGQILERLGETAMLLSESINPGVAAAQPRLNRWLKLADDHSSGARRIR
jgi:hypothetical protein